MTAKPRNYLIGIIIFMLVIGVGIDWLAALNSVDSTFTENSDYSKLNDTLNKREDLSAQVDSLKDNLDSDADFGPFGVLNGLINSAWTVIKSFFTSFGFMETVLSDAGDLIGLPGWVVGLGVMVIVVMVVFSIWSAIFQRDL